MAGISSWLSDVSRRKLRVAALGRDGLRDTINLHRFVLLKNSITQAQTELPTLPATSQSYPLARHDDRDNISVHPHANASNRHVPSPRDSEEKWLESVLETLDDFDGEVEADVHQVEEVDDFEFSNLPSHPMYDSWPPHDVPTPMSDTFLSTTSALVPLSLPHSTSFQPPFDPFDPPFPQPFLEPRYPEADYDLPVSDTSSDSDSDDEVPLTPYGGSQRSLGGQSVAEPQVYVEQEMYFSYPSRMDPISPQSIYYQQC